MGVWVIDRKGLPWETGRCTCLAFRPRPRRNLQSCYSSPDPLREGRGRSLQAVLPWRLQDFFFFFFFLHPTPHSHTSCAQSTRTCILTTLPLGLGQRRLISIQLAACSPPPLRLQAPAYPVAPAPLGPHRPAAPTSSPGTTAGAPQLALPWSFPGGPEHSRGSAQLLIALPHAGGRRELHVRSGEGAP